MDGKVGEQPFAEREARRRPTLHRIDEQFAIADFRKHGLEWEAEIPVLRNADDND